MNGPALLVICVSILLPLFAVYCGARVERNALKEIYRLSTVTHNSDDSFAVLEHEALDPEFLETLRILGGGKIGGHDECTVCHPSLPTYRPLLHQPKPLSPWCDKRGHSPTLGGYCAICGVAYAHDDTRLAKRKAKPTKEQREWDQMERELGI